MKRFIIVSCVILMMSLSVMAADLILFGGMYSTPVDQPITVSWDPQEVDGYELKIVHFLYTGLESEIVETTDTQYTFDSMPKSSRHFEIQVRAYNESSEGRVYSTWSSSTDAACSLVLDGTQGGWLLYTTPGTPSW